MRAYYDSRAREYEDFWRRRGLYADRDTPGWHDEVAALARLLSALTPARTLDVACGTGFLTRHLPGDIVGLDQSEAMLNVTSRQTPVATLVRADALSLPFENGSFERLFASFFYCHLEERERERFLQDAWRVASELIVVASPLRAGRPPVGWEERVLRDGSRWRVYKRYFTSEGLAEELGDGEVIVNGQWFLVVKARRGP